MTARILTTLALAATLASGCKERPAPAAAVAPAKTVAAPANNAAPAKKADWCAGHGVPESKCTICNPSLIAKFKAIGDWCAGHGLPESVCPPCNPGKKPPAGTAEPAHGGEWCVEHGVPESHCPKCNPSLVAKFKKAGDWCAAHGFPESVCPKCNPQKPPAGAEQAAIEARLVRLPPAVDHAAGIRTVTARRARAAAFVECTARISFHRDRVADIRAIIPGVVRKIHASLGAKVKRGDRLFLLESTRVGEAQAALQTGRERVRAAQANLKRKQELRRTGIASGRQVELAEQELATARAQARGAAATLRMAGARSASPSGRYTVTAPISGTVVRRPAVLGLLATASTSLATIADTSVMWALCDIPEVHAGRVALGQRLHIETRGGASAGAPSGHDHSKHEGHGHDKHEGHGHDKHEGHGHDKHEGHGHDKHDEAREKREETADPGVLHGTIAWIAAEVDRRTRTVTVRAEVPNAKGLLRANQFARARVLTSTAKAAVSVPRAAVQRIGDKEVVFVRTAPGTYAPRLISRRGAGDPVQVVGKVAVGDAVVTTGAVLLRTEITPGSIGAGCCVERPGAGEGAGH